MQLQVRHSDSERKSSKSSDANFRGLSCPQDGALKNASFAGVATVAARMRRDQSNRYHRHGANTRCANNCPPRDLQELPCNCCVLPPEMHQLYVHVYTNTYTQRHIPRWSFNQPLGFRNLLHWFCKAGDWCRKLVWWMETSSCMLSICMLRAY